MTYSTEIDTVSIQIDCSSLEVQQGISFMISRAVTEYNKVYIKDNAYTKQREILFNNNRLGTIRLGMNPIWNKFTRKYVINYYVAVSFYGLKSHIEILDNLSNGCLFAVCGILNTFNFNYVFTELDVCLDMNTKMDNILAICTTKLPRTEYHLLNNSLELVHLNNNHLYSCCTSFAKITTNQRNNYIDRAK